MLLGPRLQPLSHSPASLISCYWHMVVLTFRNRLPSYATAHLGRLRVQHYCQRAGRHSPQATAQWRESQSKAISVRGANCAEQLRVQEECKVATTAKCD